MQSKFAIKVFFIKIFIIQSLKLKKPVFLFSESLNENECVYEYLDETTTKQNSNNEVMTYLKTISETLNTVKNTQANLQKQIDGLHCEIQTHFKSDNAMRLSNMEKMVKESLVYSQQAYKGIRRVFGQNMSETEEKMASFFPLNLFSELESLEAALQVKENEESMVCLF